jgi:replicative DNA helicase
MEFTNGGSIIGYVTGANNKEDGSGGGSIRGETAEIIYMDEMDMIPEYILQSAINPIMISKPDTQLIASSTPIGKKASFYNWCNITPRFKEIYVPSTVLPQWDMFEPQILDESSEEAFKAEYMADFITASYGVFKSQYIAAARWNYNYHQTQDAGWWSATWRENFFSFRICIGIDWNKNDGTEFCVAAYSPTTGKFWVLEATNISPSQFSGQAYRDEVKRLNYKWNPHYIFADEGYGHTMIEDLQLEALHLSAKEVKSDWEKSIAGIVDKLTAINFSSKLELYNPATGTYVNKGAKEFLVENAVGIFEREMVRYAESDSVLTKQLGNYIVVKRGENGKIVYGLQNESIKDHRLDAFIVALGGLAIKESMYSYALNAASRTFIVGEDGPPEQTPIEDQLGDIMKLIKRNNKSKTWGMSTQKVQERAMDEADYNILKFREQEKVRSRSFAEQASTGKGYFSKKGAAEYSETHMDNGEIDMPVPMKVVPRFDRAVGRRGWR